MAIQLLIEDIDHSLTKTIVESKDNNTPKKYYIEGIFAQSEKPNLNKRIYPRSIMESALKDYQGKIDKRQALGELNHPKSMQPDPERASHIVEKLEWKGNDIWGRARILGERFPMANIAKGLIDEGISFGISTRGMGSTTEKNGITHVNEGFLLSALDIVSTPSGPDCWVNGIMESADWLYKDSWELAEQFKNRMRKMHSKQITEQKINLFNSFLRSIK